MSRRNTVVSEHLCQRRLCGVQNRAQVGDRLFGLRRDIGARHCSFKIQAQLPLVKMNGPAAFTAWEYGPIGAGALAEKIVSCM